MIKCNVTVCGTVSRQAQMRANKEGTQFASFGINIVIPANRRSGHGGGCRTSFHHLRHAECGCQNAGAERISPVSYTHLCVLVEGNVIDGTGPLSVGNTLTIAATNGDVSGTLADTEVKIVGIVRTSYYFSVDRESATIGDGTVALKMCIRDSCRPVR